MMVLTVVILLLCNAAFVDSAGGDYGHIWNYQPNGVIGPSRWAVNIPKCGGASQSPVNILTDHVTRNKDLGSLKLENYDDVGDNIYFSMKNRNTDIAFEGKVKSGVVPQAVVFNGTKYRFYQFHFHWGAANFKGSEHLVDWQRYAAELHMIHYNTKYDNVSHAAPKSDGLLVWGHFLKVNSRNGVSNSDFQTLLNNFNQASGNETNVTLNLHKLLPKSYDKFYTYTGSLTTPPCYESVRWVVNADPILVSENQMNVFRQLKDKAMGDVPIADNFRPPQNLGSRIVESNFDSSAGVLVKPCSLAIFAIVATMLFMLQ